jgi:hypothetical protein
MRREQPMAFRVDAQEVEFDAGAAEAAAASEQVKKTLAMVCGRFFMGVFTYG